MKTAFSWCYRLIVAACLAALGLVALAWAASRPPVVLWLDDPRKPSLVEPRPVGPHEAHRWN